MRRHDTTTAPLPEGRHPGRRTAVWLLVLLIAASLGLNLWYASHGLDHSRYWDEQFSLDNVRALLASGSLRPANGYYQSLSYLPQAALLAAARAGHRWTGWDALAVFDPDRRFSATSYFLCRLLQVVYGAGVLALTFSVGRRLISPTVGLLGAFFLAVTPWFVQGTTMYKPDILVALAALAALYWSLRAVERPGAGSYTLAGSGVALAASAKLNGALAGIPLLVGSLLSPGSWRRRALLLLAAGGAGVAVFVALNPYFTLYPSFLAHNLDLYSESAARSSSTRWAVPRQVMELVVSWAGHGRVVGSLALVGAVALAVRLARRWAGGRRTPGEVQRWMMLSFPLGYPAAYAVVTPDFRSHNFLPVLPFTALLAAWAGVGAWGLAARKLPALRRPWTRLPAAGLVVAFLVPVPFLYVYRELVPTTEELARAFLHRRFVEQGETRGRVVYSEGLGVEEPSAAKDVLGMGGAAVVPVDRLDTLPASRLRGSDGEIFPASRLDGEAADFYWRQLAEAPTGAVRRVGSGPFVARGLARIAVASPWRLVGSERLFAGALPDPSEGPVNLSFPRRPEAGESLSFVVVLHGARRRPRLEVGSRSVDLAPTLGRVGLAPAFVSPRLTPPRDRGEEGPPSIRLWPPPGASGDLAAAVDVLRWRPPEEGGSR